MKLLEIPVTTSEKINYLLQPIQVNVKGTQTALSEVGRNAWQPVIDDQLPGWARDEGLEPPTPEILPVVKEVAVALRDQ